MTPTGVAILLILVAVVGIFGSLALLAYFYASEIWLAIRQWRRRVTGHCPWCGYDLTGNVSGMCPECGMATRK